MKKSILSLLFLFFTLFTYGQINYCDSIEINITSQSGNNITLDAPISGLNTFASSYAWTLSSNSGMNLGSSTSINPTFSLPNPINSDTNYICLVTIFNNPVMTVTCNICDTIVWNGTGWMLLSMMPPPCNLTGGSVYLDYGVSPAMMNATVNGMSMYDYVWNNGITGANQTQIYSGWCVTITDLVSGCDTTICENCIPDTTTICPCPMIYMPVCGCDGVMYANSCIAICAGVGWTPAVSNGMPGGWLPCTTSLTTCFVELTASGSTTFCEGDSVQLQPSVYDINGAYLWNTGSTNHEIWVSLTGDYILSYTNDTGCVATDTMHVEVIPEPTLIAYTSPNPAIICLGDTLVIELTPGLSNYYWNTGNPLHQDQDRIEITPTQDFIYVCEALDTNGCESRVEIEVFVDSCATGVYSEVFSEIEIYPNPTKSTLNISLPQNESFKISLFNIEGKLVFERKEVKNIIQISSENMEKGSYILQIENNIESLNRKVIFK